MSNEEDWKGYVKLTDEGVDFLSKYGEYIRKSLEQPRDNPICYTCDTQIEGKAKYIEYIPLFMRYVCFCDECHTSYNQGEYVEVIKVYESYLAGLSNRMDYMKVYYKFHPDKFNEFLDKIPESKRDIIRGLFE